MNAFKSERDMVQYLTQCLKERGHEPTVEVPFLGRSIDLVYKTSDGKVNAVELKLQPRHMQRALEQAKICLLGADRVYICLPAFDVGEKMILQLRSKGIGLILLNGNKGKAPINYKVGASKSNPIKRAEYSRLLKSRLADRGNG